MIKRDRRIAHFASLFGPYKEQIYVKIEVLFSFICLKEQSHTTVKTKIYNRGEGTTVPHLSAAAFELQAPVYIPWRGEAVAAIGTRGASIWVREHHLMHQFLCRLQLTHL